MTVKVSDILAKCKVLTYDLFNINSIMRTKTAQF